jgi:hypothetical protein
MTETTLEPIESSADGKRNAFHHHCAIVQGNKPYAVCLHLCEKRKQKALPVIYSDCSAAIGRKACPALKMRKEEIEKGHAIYFKERLRGDATYNATPVFSSKKRSKSRVTNPPPEKPKNDLVDSGNFADAINVAMEEKKPAEAPKMTPLPGESLLDMARRIMNQQGAKA